jgi:hypothetical protein
MAFGARSSFIAALVLACGCGKSSGTAPPREASWTAVTISPARAAPAQAVRVTFPTPYKIGDTTKNGSRVHTRFGPSTAQSYDNYHVLIYGPSGRRCRGHLRFALGYLTARRSRRERTVTIGPLRFGAGRPRARTWCAGDFRGRVEYRQPDRRPPIPFEQLGNFGFSVRR